jgi:hypothetical protein
MVLDINLNIPKFSYRKTKIVDPTSIPIMHTDAKYMNLIAILSVFLKLYFEFKKKLREIPAKTLIKLDNT